MLSVFVCVFVLCLFRWFVLMCVLHDFVVVLLCMHVFVFCLLFVLVRVRVVRCWFVVVCCCWCCCLF